MDPAYAGVTINTPHAAGIWNGRHAHKTPILSPMSVIAALLLLAAQTTGTMTLGELKALPPEQAGEQLLEGKTHGRIATFAPVQEVGMRPPGFTRYELVEVPVQVADGCVRKKWSASFRLLPKGAENNAVLFNDAYPVEEVALPSSGQCTGAHYVHVNPIIASGTALRMLHILRDVASGKRKVRFACASEVGADFCSSNRRIRAHLSTNPAWAVSKEADGLVLFAGQRGGIVTIIGFDPDRPDHVSVVRKIPNPF